MGFYGKRRSVSRITSPDVVQKAFIVLWCLTIIWCEVGFFHLSLKDCRWPEKRLKVSVRRLVFLRDLCLTKSPTEQTLFAYIGRFGHPD